MKFRFCGDLDCPDWVLAEIATLSKLSSVRMKVLTAQIILYCINGNFNYDKVLKLASSESDGISDLKGAVAALHFIIANAAKHDLNDLFLVQEIQQLGLPKENSDAIGKLYKEKKDEMRNKFALDSYSVTKILKTDWRIDSVIATSDSTNTGTNSRTGTTAHLKFTVDTRPQDGDINRDSNSNVVIDGYRIKELAFELTPEKLDTLVHELSRAYSIVDGLEG